jgi:hypothetical protein
MSKITFRADDELIRQLEECDASKSEVMRKALRKHLERHAGERSPRDSELAGQAMGPIDDLIADRVDQIISDRLDGAFTPKRQQDINVNIQLDGEAETEPSVDADASGAALEPPSHEESDSETDDGDQDPVTVDGPRTCSQCGEPVDPGHVYCPNCGEKANHHVYCECGDELQSDWAFCPNCGRRTPAAEVLDQP